MNESNIIMYTTEDGLTKIETTFDGDTVWLSKAQMAELFQRDRSVISKHIKNVFEEGELTRESNVQILHIANSDKPVEFYNLDVIISVGYRVKSQRGTQFRIWASGVLKEYMKKGFALDDDRLKRLGGGNYFEELLARIRDMMTRRDILTTKGRVSHKQAIDKAHQEYEKYKKKQEDQLSAVEQHFIESIKELEDLPCPRSRG